MASFQFQSHGANNVVLKIDGKDAPLPVRSLRVEAAVSEITRVHLDCYLPSDIDIETEAELGWEVLRMSNGKRYRLTEIE